MVIGSVISVFTQFIRPGVPSVDPPDYKVDTDQDGFLTADEHRFTRMPLHHCIMTTLVDTETVTNSSCSHAFG